MISKTIKVNFHTSMNDTENHFPANNAMTEYRISSPLFVSTLSKISIVPKMQTYISRKHIDINDNRILQVIFLTIGSLRNHDGNGNCNAMFLSFQNFIFKRFLVFCSNLLPLRVSEVVLFNFTTWKPISGVLYLLQM